MYFIQKMEKFNEDDLALLFRAMFDRFPILILAEEQEKITNFIDDLLIFINFRNKQIFYTDFATLDEYKAIIENEEADLDVQRTLFICYPDSVQPLIKEIQCSFKSWIIGKVDSSIDNTDSSDIKEVLYENSPFYVIINIKDGKESVNLEGKHFPSFDLKFEKQLMKNVILGTEVSIEKMKRVLAKKVDLKHTSKEQLKLLLDFDHEEIELKKNLIQKEALDFYQAAKRALYIMNRMEMLKQFGMDSSLADKTLSSTISYEAAKADRILDFIQSEWGIKFEAVIKSGRTSNFGDLIESMWG
jgi:hypothetical protein